MKNSFNINKIESPLLKNILNYRKTIIIVFLLLLGFFSAFFQIEPEEVGVITRFGKFVKKVEPGLNMKIPFIDELYKVPVERQQKLEFGFRTVKAGVHTQYSKSVAKDESLMLTGDLNLADVEWVVQYRINDAYNYLFKVRNPKNTLRDVSEAALRQIIGDRTVNEVLTVGRTEIATKMEALVNQICKEYSLGIKIDQIVLQDVNPPQPVKAAFNAVNQAQQERETLINQAKSEYNKVIPKASGQAEETIQKAEGFATQRVNKALGEVARFNAIYKEYMKAPGVTRSRIYLETMASVLPKLGNKIIIDEQGNNVLPLLQMQLNK
ncbi:FtsH protease activity modulator HflK [Polaribacter sp. L3A8]|uniref:FtsH protease activity modulator HflK n=1 Tax=Polaribacter sp. L3A8 TaxID=2686361 RepID=UPI00131D009A|nr:FtsH protease activity modulator HflK [Polaribacter sp. L3A8]